MYCRACDEFLSPHKDTKFCDECGHEVGTPVPKKYRFGPQGEAFGGWLSFMFWGHFLGILALFLIILFGAGIARFEFLFVDLGIFFLAYCGVLVFLTLMFLERLRRGKKEAYILFLIFIPSEVIGLIWSFFVASPNIYTIFFRLAVTIAWLNYFYQSERVFEHFGTNFPTSQQKEIIAKMLKRQTVDKLPREIDEVSEEIPKYIGEKRPKSPSQKKINHISIVLISILLVCTAMIAPFEIVQNIDEARRRSNVFPQLRYADSLDFNFRLSPEAEDVREEAVLARDMMVALQYVDPDSPLFKPRTEVVFVYTEEEALKLPDSVIAAWPSVQTLRGINALNWERQVFRDGYLSEDLSLTFPITIADVVENWNEVNYLHLRWHEDSLRQGNSPEFIAEMIDLLWEKRSEPAPQTLVLAEDIYFAEKLGFELRMMTDGGIVSDPVQTLLYTQAIYPEFFDPLYTDFLFVESEEKALRQPDNAITAWPAQETQERINALNWLIQDRVDRQVISADLIFAFTYYVPETSLLYPLTVTDIMDSREEFDELWRALQETFIRERDLSNLITSPWGYVRREGNSPEFLAELERLKEQRDAETSE